MKPAPRDWPRISSALYYADARQAIDWLCRAFAFEVRIVVGGEDGSLMHSELTYGGGVIMVDGERPGSAPARRAPSGLGGANTQNLFVYVEDIEAHCAQARAAGAEILTEPKTTDYGAEYWSDRGYEARDPGGHHWWFAQRVRTAAE